MKVNHMSTLMEMTDRDSLLAIRRYVRSDLPLLRRFGRALTGSRQLADMCVVQLMNDVIDSPEIVGTSRNPRVALYKHFVGTLKALSQEPEVESALAVVQSASRQVQLLVSVEGFSRHEAAEILNVSEQEVNSMLAAAADGCLTGNASILVIEDEPLISMQLEQLISELGHRVLGIAATRRQANKLMKANVPDLVLSDAQLADGSSGIEAVNDVLALRDVPVIYITAFPERLLTGRRGEPNFLISKPFDAQAVKAIIGQALFLKFQAQS